MTWLVENEKLNKAHHLVTDYKQDNNIELIKNVRFKKKWYYLNDVSWLGEEGST